MVASNLDVYDDNSIELKKIPNNSTKLWNIFCIYVITDKIILYHVEFGYLVHYQSLSCTEWSYINRNKQYSNRFSNRFSTFGIERGDE